MFFALLLLAAPPGDGGAARAAEALRLATTTSTENSGLLAELNPVFTEQTGIAVHVIAVGTGKALKLGENGDVDAVLVHAPRAEQAFVAAGFGVDRRPVMHNAFVLVGPRHDPAGIRVVDSATAALASIAERGVEFVSRGDDSGTHKQEVALWEALGLHPVNEPWYLAAGQGMGAVLTIASEKQAYTLTDRGTWLAMQRKLDLALLYAGDPALHNPYHYIRVNPERHDGLAVEAARRYGDFLTGPRGQALIGAFRVEDEPLFVPDALPSEHRTGAVGPP